MKPSERLHLPESSPSTPPIVIPNESRSLEVDLRASLRGEVGFDAGTRALYATDASNYRQVPIGVVFPKDERDVIKALELCRERRAPVLPRGGGTSLAGQCCNTAVILDFSRFMNRILEFRPEKGWARVQPGLVLDVLRQRAEAFHLTFGPDPSTHNHCTLGGMIGNDSCGVHSVMAGRTAENVQELDVLLYDGTRLRVGPTSEEELAAIIRGRGRRADIYRRLKALRDRCAPLIRSKYPKIPRRVSGYNLDELLPENGFNVARALVGTEGTCVWILSAKVRLVHSPPARSLLVLGYPDVYSAGDHIEEVLEGGPIGLEGLDDVLTAHMRKKGVHTGDMTLLPKGRGWLMAEFGGETKAEADAQAHALMDRLRGRPSAPSLKLFDRKEEEDHLWKVRESGLGATARVPGEKDTWEGWEDSAVPPPKLGEYLRGLRRLFERYGYGCALYGHFGQGCVHTRIDFDLASRPGIAKYRAFVEDAADLVVKLGGSFSGEHGDGQSRAELLPKMFGPELVQAFEEFKGIWDPDNRMNPGKKVNAFRMDQNLRLGAGFEPARTKTHFKFPDDKGSLSYASLRCVGIGECRREEGGTMCPSYRATREEQHSTRGRAHLLFEMLQGGVARRGWHDPHVKEALDLCLSCKGCKSDCPMSVDMATYKAEFLSHYYQGRLRPRVAYAMGLIFWWARLASLWPGLANFVSHAKGISAVFKGLCGLAPQRSIPKFSERTFRQQLRQRPSAAARANQPRVLLWVDTFSNHFYPQTALAAMDVLEAAGFHVLISEKKLCCGRPLYDYGMLKLAKRQLNQILRSLGTVVADGTPVVVLEPSCAATFRDELLNLFPDDPVAKRLSQQTYFFAEFLEKKAPGFHPPEIARKAIVHGHCHQKSISPMSAEKTVMTQAHLNFELLDSGCCGLAGSFGYQRGSPYEVSQKVGERVLLPSVRAAREDTLLIADGFSCRSQILQNTGRQALHLAEVLQSGLRQKTIIPAYRRWPKQLALATFVGLAVAVGLWARGSPRRFA